MRAFANAVLVLLKVVSHRNPLPVFTASVQANHHHQHSTNCTQSTNIEANANLPRPVGYDAMLPLPRLPVAALEPPIKWCKDQFLLKVCIKCHRGWYRRLSARNSNNSGKLNV